MGYSLQLFSEDSDIDIRLVPENNSNTSGIIELSIRGEWRSVCHDLWTNADAVVACKQLGLPHTGKLSVLYVYVSLSKPMGSEAVNDIPEAIYYTIQGRSLMNSIVNS